MPEPHAAYDAVASIELIPPHPPREETPIYRRAHHQIIAVEDRPCHVCGVKQSDLDDPARRVDPLVNPYGATQMESHHFPIERSLAEAVDRERLARDYPEVLLHADLMDWIDSPGNLIALCDVCHRGSHGVHHILAQDFAVLPYLRRGADGRPYALVTTRAALVQDEQTDAAILNEKAP